MVKLRTSSPVRW